MGTRLADIEAEALRLRPKDRLRLLERIWDSLEPDDVPLTRAQREELDRRLDRVDAGKPKLVPGSKVMREARSRLK